MSDFYSTKTIKARKEHRCYHCKEQIKPGENYIKIAGVYMGDFFTHKEHEHCHDLLMWCLDAQGDGEYNEDTMYEVLSEHLCYKCPKLEECDRETIVECGIKMLKIKEDQ